jgi:hypothetical protein
MSLTDQHAGGIDGGSGIYFAKAGDDVHGVGSLMPLAPVVGCIVIRPDGTCLLARLEPDPLADQRPDA